MMKTVLGKFATRLLGILLLLAVASPALTTLAEAQMPQFLQEEQMRQMYQRQQMLEWQRQEQLRQMYDRQQWLQWQQQERLRQLYQR